MRCGARPRSQFRDHHSCPRTEGSGGASFLRSPVALALESRHAIVIFKDFFLRLEVCSKENAMKYVWKVEEGSKVNLKHYDPNYTDKLVDPDDAKEELAALGKELSDLQELLAAAQHHSLLIVLQGMDTSGKDGTIRHVFSHVNPQGCYVHSFKEPTPEELAHDFLWRVHKVTPDKGVMGIFNRSHYEDVLVARVHKLVPENVWNQRYAEINHFE